MKEESLEEGGSDEDKLVNFYRRKIEFYEFLGVCFIMESYFSGLKLFLFYCG